MLRTRHGSAARNNRVGPIVETTPIDELPAGVPDRTAIKQPARNAKGHYQPGHAATREAARQAGHAKKNHTALASALNVQSGDPVWRKYQRQAEAFRRMHVRQLARDVGDGTVGCAPAALIGSAALALAGSRFAYDRGDFALGSKLAVEARSHLLGAHELVVRETRAKPPKPFAWDTASAEQDAAEDEPDEPDPDNESFAATDAATGRPGAGNGASR
jgi:hypothetical protein